MAKRSMTLIRSKEAFRAIVETSLDGIYQVDTSGRLLFVNESFASLFGYEREELLGKHFADMLSAETFPKVEKMVHEVLSGKNVRDEVDVKHKDGHEIPVRFSATPLREQGKIVGLTGILSDITERKRMEKALRESEEWHRALAVTAGKAGLGITAVQDTEDREAVLVFANDEYCRMSGYSRDELLGMSALDTVSPADRDTIRKRYRRREKGKDVSVMYEARMLRKDGTQLPIDTSVSTMNYRGKLATVSFFRDITDRKQVEEALREAYIELEKRVKERTLELEKANEALQVEIGEHRRAEEAEKGITREFLTILDNSVDMIYRMNLQSCTYDYLSPSSEIVLGYTPEEFKALGFENASNLVHPDDLEMLSKNILELIELGPEQPATGPVEYRMNHRQLGYRWVSDNRSIIYDDRNVPVAAIGILRDVTERKHAEQALLDSERNYRVLFESQIDGVAVFNAEKMKIVLANETALKLYGFDSLEEVFEANPIDYIHPDDRDRVLRVIAEDMLEKDLRQVIEFRTVTKDGKVKWTSALGTRIEYQGKIAGLGSFRDITEQKRAEEALQESERRFREMADLLPQTVLEIDRTGTLTFLNRIGFESSGYSQADLDKGLSAFKLLVPEDREIGKENLQLILSGDKSLGTEYTALRKDGTTFPVILYSSPIIRDKQPVGIRAVAVDITERKQAEEALKESEEAGRALLNAPSDSAILTDRDGVILDLNEVAAGRFGKSRDELTGVCVHDIVPPELARGRRAQARKVIRSGLPVRFGDERAGIIFDNTYYPLFDTRGKVTRIAIFARDVTERKKAEQALEESEQKYRELADMLPQIIYETDEKGNLTFVNRNAFESTGYTQDDIEKGLHALQVFIPEDRERGEKNMRMILSGERLGGNEYTMLKKDGGTFPVIAFSSPITREGETVGIRGVVIDITELKRAEDALRESEEKLRIIFDNVGVGLTITDMAGIIVDVNETTLRMKGYSSKEEVIGLNGFDFVAEKDRTIALEGLKGLLEDEVGQPMEIALLTKDGGELEVECSSTIIRDSSGNAAGLINVERDVTERKRAEDALRESEARFRAIFDGAAIGIGLVDRIGRPIEINPSLQKMLGYTTEELRSLAFTDYMNPEDATADMALFEEMIEGKRNQYQVEKSIIRKDGQTIYGQITLSAVRDAEGRLEFVIGMLEDITERKRAEESLQISERKFKDLTETTPDWVWEVDKNGVYTYVSPNVEQLLGYRADEVLGKTPFDFMPQEEAGKIGKIFKEILTKGERIDRLENVNRHRDGHSVVLETNGIPIFDEEGRLKGYRGVDRDVTERRHMEEELRKREEHFKALIENSLEAIVIIDHEGVIQYLAPSFERLMGYELKEYLGKSPFDHVHTDDRSRVAAIFAELIQKPGAIVQEEVRVLHKNDSLRTVEVVGQNLLHNPAVGGLVANIRDITERKQAEEKLQALYRQEKELRQKIETEMKKRIEFTRALAHELKTPLTSVLASSDLLVSELVDEPLVSLAKNINQGASNLNSRIDELLDLARGEVGMLKIKREQVDLSQLLQESADSMTPLALGRRQSIALRLPPALPTVQADTVRLQQILTNLLNNAVKFTPRGGEIILRAREKDASVIVEVQDTGRGISKKEQELLFEPYQRLEDNEGNLSGLGLGLSLCKTLVELHGGQIWVRSRAGRGSTFGFSLPLETADRQAIAPAKTAKLWKVLIIEDDKEIVNSVSLTFRLRWPEAQLISTGLGEEGIDMVETEAPDIVILDLGLPDMSGFEALRQIRLFSSVPVIILTVKDDESDMVKGLDWGADDYMVKPFKQLELLARLKVQLRKQTPPDEEAPIIYGPLRLDPSTFQLTYEGKEINLTIIEGRIIECLMRNAGHVVTHSRLAETVWGEDYSGALDSLRVYIRYLREKLEANPSKPKLILTKAGVGYSLVKPI